MTTLARLASTAPQRPPPALRGGAAAGRPGGARAHHRHRRRDRRPLRRQPRHLRDRRRAALAAGLAEATRSCGTSATRPTRTRSSPAAATSSTRSASTAGSRRSARARVRARHHGRRPRLDLDRLRRRAQGGHAPGQGEDGSVVAVIGDGAMTGGVAFEAVHQAGGLGTPLVVMLNDNGMSISPNVGALSRYFNRVRLDPGCGRRARASRSGSPSCRPASAPRSSASARSSRSRSRRSGRPACGGRSSTGPTSGWSTATTWARCAAHRGRRRRPCRPSQLLPPQARRPECLDRLLQLRPSRSKAEPIPPGKRVRPPSAGARMPQLAGAGGRG